MTKRMAVQRDGCAIAAAVVLLAYLAAPTANAQQSGALPEIHVTAPPNDLPPPKENLLSNGDATKRNDAASTPKADGQAGCGGAGAGNADAHSIGCLNQQLKRQVDQVNPTEAQPPLDAKSPDIKVGTVNIPAVQQQYGQNFGHSVIPFRPPPPVYSSGLGRR
jgi:hypothetical protein